MPSPRQKPNFSYVTCRGRLIYEQKWHLQPAFNYLQLPSPFYKGLLLARIALPRQGLWTKNAMSFCQVSCERFIPFSNHFLYDQRDQSGLSRSIGPK